MIFIRKKIRQQAITCQRIFLGFVLGKGICLVGIEDSPSPPVHFYNKNGQKSLSFEILNHSYLIYWTAASCWPARLRAYQTAQVYHILM